LSGLLQFGEESKKTKNTKNAQSAKPAEHDHSMSQSWGNNQNPRIALTCGFISVNTGKADDASGCLAKLEEISKQFTSSGDLYRAKQVRIMERELFAEISLSKKNYPAAIEALRTATTLEEEMSPPSGPPDIIKPSHEALGEALLKANRPKEAVEAFKIALSRQPNRARSLIGLARALAKSGDNQAAGKAYSDLLKIWSDADPPLVELKEARDFIANTGARQ
jgi:tetratricopeptide (TPR) repeat protein